MTDIADYLRTAIAAQTNNDPARVHIHFDASRERTIAVVVCDERTDVYICNAGSDDDDYTFVETDDRKDRIYIPFQDDDANDGNDES